MSSKNTESHGSGKQSLFEVQRIKIEQVRALLGPLPEKLALYCTDACIKRYLCARNWNVKKATKMLKATLKWRLDYNPEEIRWNTNSTQGQIRYLIYCMENAILNLPADQEQMVWLINFHGFSMSNISVKVTKETAIVLQDRYPERLDLAILYNPPKIFESFFTLVKPFLEPKTRKKVKFVYADDQNSQKIMEDLFNMDELETAFGGNNQVSFNITDYAMRMREDDKRMPLYWSGENASELSVVSTINVDSESDSDESVEENEENSSSLPDSLEELNINGTNGNGASIKELVD